MMRAVFVTVAIMMASCLATALPAAHFAATATDPDFVNDYIITPLDVSKEGTTDNLQIVKYAYKLPKDFPSSGPVLFGISGRASLSDAKANLALFDQVRPNFDKAALVYVGQRFFEKTISDNTTIKYYDELFPLTLEATVNDNVLLIQKLAKKFGSKNFFVFGTGHGAAIAGYVAKRFADKDELSEYKVMAWGSSSPIKYFRQGNDFTGTDFQEINRQVAALLAVTDTAGCTTAAITNFGKIWVLLRSLRTDAGVDPSVKTTNAEFTAAIPVVPQPTLVGAVATATDPTMREFIIFWRNKLLDLTSANRLFNKQSGARDANPILKKVCTAAAAYTDVTPPGGAAPTMQSKLNAISAVLKAMNADADLSTLKWKLKDATTGEWNRDLALRYYTDCTNFQLVWCPLDKTPGNDPFVGTQWNIEKAADAAVQCNSLDSWKKALNAECKGLLGTATPTTTGGVTTAGPAFNSDDYQVSETDFPRSLKKNAITTMNKQSVYYGSYARFAKDTDVSNYAKVWDLWGVDGWEFEKPKVCATDKLKEVQFLSLRAFSCFSKILVNSNNVCDKKTLFDYTTKEKKEPNDAQPAATVGDCSTNSDTYPFAHPDFKPIYQDPNNPRTTRTSTSSSTLRTSTAQPKTSTGGSGGSSGAGGVSATMSVVFASVYVVFVTFNNNNNN